MPVDMHFAQSEMSNNAVWGTDIALVKFWTLH